jgi:hypothetical protein
MTRTTPDRLLELLEALCEERLTEVERAELERAVLEGAEARRTYLLYIDLHGMLHWDAAAAARPDSVESVVTPADGTRSVPSPLRRRVVRTVLGVAAALLLTVSIALWGPRPFGPDVNQGPGIAGPTHPDVPHDAGPVDDTPIRLGPADSQGNSVPIAAGGPSDDSQRPDESPLPADASASSLGIVRFIDEEIARVWADAGLTPSPLADDAEWLRRLSLDLAGRIPSVEEAEAFLADADPEKRRRLVDALLDRPEAARHFATVWTNLLVGRSPAPEIDRAGLHGFLAEQFQVNRPWIGTVAQLVAAEGSGRENAAANFLLAHMNNEAVPATAVTARCFLGQQVQCTQCHEHPFHKVWGQDQFWELNSFFDQTEVARHTRVNPQTGATEFSHLELVSKPIGGATYYETRSGEMKAVYPRFAGQDVDGGAETNRRRELARLMTAGDQPQLARAFVNRTWAHFLGYAFTNPVDDMGPHNPPTHPELLDRLAGEFIKSGYDVKQLTRWICNSAPYQLTSRFVESNAVDDPEAGEPPYFSRMYVKPLTAEQLFDSLLVATRADHADAYARPQADRDRQQWLRQFFTLEQTEENCEASTFDGSLPQALTMMNGDLVQQATSGAPGTLLGDVLAGQGSEADKIRRLSLAVLSRYPTPAELESLRTIISQIVRSRVQAGSTAGAQAVRNDALRDVYWGYLNSAEFVVNH